jgi:hypothetical protein
MTVTPGATAKIRWQTAGVSALNAMFDGHGATATIACRRPRLDGGRGAGSRQIEPRQLGGYLRVLPGIPVGVEATLDPTGLLSSPRRPQGFQELQLCAALWSLRILPKFSLVIRNAFADLRDRLLSFFGEMQAMGTTVRSRSG